MTDDTLDGLLAAGARRGRHIAVIDGARRASLTRFDAHVTALASALRRSGIGEGDRVAIEMAAGLDALACLFAVLRAGGTVMPVHPQAPDRALRRWLAMGGVRGVISAANDDARRAALALASSVQVAELRSGSVAAVLSTLDAAAPASPAPTAHGPADLAGIFITTGTTGDGALVRHTHASLVASVRALEAMRRDYFRADGRAALGNLAQLVLSYRGKLRWAVGRQTWLTPMPLHSIAGMRFMMQAVLTGQRLVVMPSFRPRALLAEVARHRVNILALTPTMLEALLAVRPRARDDVSSVLAIGLGAAPASAGLIRRASAAFGCPVLNGYGSTETGGGILAARIGGAPDGNVGYPFPGTEVRVVDAAGAAVPDGTVGELICRTPTLGAADDRGTGTDGWYHTGDLARVGGRGEIHIVGRCRDLIIRGGLKIVPAAVEKALGADPSVGACAVVGMPDQLAGERIVAFVVPAGRHQPDTARLVAGCRARLAAHEVPDHVLIVPELPRAESGEVRKAELRTLAVRALRPETRTGAVSQGGAVQ